MNDMWKKRILILTVVLVIGAISIINYRLQNENTLETSADFIAYEEKQLSDMKENLIVGERVQTQEDQPMDVEASTQSSTDDYFGESKAAINMDRNRIISMLTEIIENREVDSESRNKATEQKLQIVEYMKHEKIIENLLNNKGFEEVLILITDNSVNITVHKDTLNKSDIAKILDIVMRETGRPFEQISIQTKH